MSFRILPAVVLALLVAACTGSPGGDGDDPGQPPTDGEAGEGNGDGEGTTIVEVNVESGDLAGTYSAEGPKLDCNVSDTGSGATFLDMDATDGVYGITFVSNDGSTDPAEFSFSADFAGETSFNEDPLGDFERIEIDTGMFDSEPVGEGTAHRTDSGDMITWDVDGTTADGVDVTASITCGPVDRR